MIIELGQAYSFLQQGGCHSQEDARFPDVDIPLVSQRFFVVCDGVGGAAKGEIASRTVCDAIGEAMSKFDLSKPFAEKKFALVLGNAYDALKKASAQAKDIATTMYQYR